MRLPAKAPTAATSELIYALISALVFDFDGLILDTETSNYRSWQELYAEFGQTLPLPVWTQHLGSMGAFDPLEYLERLVGRPIDRAALGARRSASHRASVEAEQPRPGVQATLLAARALGLKTAVASSSSRNWVGGHLERLGLIQLFDCLCTGDEVVQRKPDPDLYLLALERLGVAGAQAIAFEDAPNGALAARRAGLRCVVVPCAMTSGLTFGAHDLRLGALGELPLAELIARVTAP